MYRDGVPEEDQRRLFQHARLSLAEQDAVRNLSRLGVRLNRVREWQGRCLSKYS
jgi:syntaxin-binding protein 1